MDNLYNNMMSLEGNHENPDEDISNIFWSMCASCKKIKDTKNNWIQLESYLINHFDIAISHGICPGCVEKLYPGMI
jgi:hypothetical protein